MNYTNSIDRWAVELPAFVYGRVEPLANPEYVALAGILVLAVTTAVVGAYSTVAKPRVAKTPDPKLKLYHPTDLDGCKYFITNKSQVELGDQSIKWFHVALFPVATALTLVGFYFLMQLLASRLNTYLNWFFLLQLPVSVVVTGRYVMNALARKWPALSMTRFQILFWQNDTLPIGEMDSDTPEAKGADKLPEYVTIWSAPLPTMPPRYTIVTDAKFLILWPFTAMLAWLFYHENSVLCEGAHANWVITNVVLFCCLVAGIYGLQFGRFSHLAALLVALFVYDIYFVFRTPMMVAVATELQVPIKMLVPKLGHSLRTPAYALIGTGDIVLPGAFLLFLMRFDLHMFYSRHPELPFHFARRTPSTYFITGVSSYAVGLLLTIIVLQITQHGQPALLYIVPSLLVGTLSVTFMRGDLNALFRFIDDIEYDEEDADADYVPDDLFDEWVERVEEKREMLEDLTDDDDGFVYQFLGLDDDDDDTFIIDAGDDSDDDDADAVIYAEEIQAMHEERRRPAQEWYSDNDE